MGTFPTYLIQNCRKEGAIAETKWARSNPPADKYALLSISVLARKLESLTDTTTEELCTEVANQVQVTKTYTSHNTKFSNIADSLPTK